MNKKIKKLIFISVILLFMIIQLYPVLWLFMASIKPSVELSSTPFALPQNPTLINFKNVLSDGKMGLYMCNSVKVTGLSIILILIFSSTAGFALSKFNFKISKKFYAFFTFGIMIPVQITLIPLFIFYGDIGILNTTFSLVLPQVGFALPLSVMMFYSFYSFLPNELLEAGIIDGCTTYGLFTKIVFPLAKNTVITVSSMYSILIWNDFIFANTFISDDSAKTVAMGLKDYVGAFGNVDWGSTYAAITLTILPPLIIYFVLNRWVTSGITMGATKG